jgi:hypothetical protein
MPQFEIADVEVRLGGDAANTVPRYNVTAAEIAVLQVIHGNDAIFNVKPRGTIERAQRVERARLAALYQAKDSDGNVHVEKLYPGAAARVFETLDELILADTQFHAEPVRRGNTERQKSELELIDEANKMAAPGFDPFAASAPDAEDAANGLDELPADPPATSTFE